MENMEELKKELFEYIKDNTFKDTKDLEYDTMIFKEGIFDSMGFVLLVDHLESTYKISMEDRDLVEENFESINALADFIQKKDSPVIQKS